MTHVLTLTDFTQLKLLSVNAGKIITDHIMPAYNNQGCYYHSLKNYFKVKSFML